MKIVILAVLFIGLMLMGLPTFSAMGTTGIIAGIYFWSSSGIPFATFAQRMFAGMNSFSMLAVPMFLLAGKIMNEGLITDRIFKFCQKLVGHLPGGLGHVNVLCSVIFAGMSGTAIADAAGLGQIEIKAMTDQGFDKEFSVGVTGGSALIGPIIPPSVPMVIYASVAECSVAGLFMGGILPGVLMAAGMMGVVAFYAIKKHYPREERASLKEIWIAFREGFFALLCPLIIIGGIWGGVFTATEAAAVAVVYAIIINLFVYKSMTLKGFWKHLKEAAVDSAAIMLIMGAVKIYSYTLTRSMLPQTLAKMLITVTANPVIIVILIILFLLIMGCFMGTTSVILLFGPIFVPVIESFGYDLITFGVIVCLTLVIGQLTPPYGGSLLVLSKTTKIPLNRVAIACAPYMAVVLIVIALCVAFPSIITFLPKVALS